ncbi:hypothetical protein KP509_18G004600 [Ceratopteris richardii]|uniref:APS kinase domain-containing protein n=1 Tax=Ceratopteris richardii TaxID=49495 RepID=A0A8T2SM30_CERRI|nr:hypothetical protein KP509_18G004600 [Ceratopteris richardii]
MSMDLECWRLHHPSIDKFIYSGDMRTSLAVIRSFQGKFRHARCFSRCLSGGSRIICCTSTSDELFTSRVSKGLYSGSLPTCARQHQCTQGLYPSACSLFDGETLGNRDPRYGTQTEQVYSSSIDQPSTMQKPESTLPGLIQHSAKSVGKSTNIVWQQCIVSRENREELLQQRGCVVWITGLSGSGKSTLACTLDHELCKRGNLSYVLDGDNLRHGLNKNLGFSLEDRAENIRRIGRIFSHSKIIFKSEYRTVFICKVFFRGSCKDPC